MNEILQTTEFLRRVESRMRFGELSRERLNLTRVELRGTEAACDWMTRNVDVWDHELPGHVRERHYAVQALQDALKMRELVFESFDEIESAELRAFQNSEGGAPQLVMTGTVYRNAEVPARVVSTGMRAKLYGFKFLLAGETLMRLVPERSHSTDGACGTAMNTIQRRH